MTSALRALTSNKWPLNNINHSASLWVMERLLSRQLAWSVPPCNLLSDGEGSTPYPTRGVPCEHW